MPELRGDLFTNRHAWRNTDGYWFCKWCGATTPYPMHPDAQGECNGTA